MTATEKDRITNAIKLESNRLGFISCGISKAEFLEEEAERLENWLKKGMHGKMSYMERNFDKRLDPTLLVEGAKSVISLSYNYYPQTKIDNSDFKISKYAYGMDYHFVIKEKLKSLLEFIRDEVGDVYGRVFVDSAPILERAWAKKSGLGWVGKNSNLVSKKIGSYFFLCEIILDLELIYNYQDFDHCGTCTACIDACPTQAIEQPCVVNGSKCISYHTIELKENIPNEFKGKFDDWIFGCDICQDVCPWNRFSKSHNEPLFNPNDDLRLMDKTDWVEMTKETFDKVFQKSPLKRTGFDGIKRNIEFLKKV